MITNANQIGKEGKDVLRQIDRVELASEPDAQKLFETIKPTMGKCLESTITIGPADFVE